MDTLKIWRWIKALGLTMALAQSYCGGLKSSPGSARLSLNPCHVDRLAEEVQCGVHEVYEDRATSRGRRIPIHVAVLPAFRRDTRPDPLFLLAGGPGQGARSYAALAARAFQAVRRSRDVVLVDLRGTGASNALSCKPPGDEFDPVAVLSAAAVGACRTMLDADPRFYSHNESLADLDEVRRLLGYERINLWGGSWGTRAALLYAMRYPDAVRSVVLDGAVPLSLRFPESTARDGQRALDLLLNDCEQDEVCRAAFPDLRPTLSRVLSRLTEHPVAATFPHPRTGGIVPMTLTREMFVEFLRVLLYSPADSALLPSMVTRAAHGDFSPIAAQLTQFARWSIDTMALGATLSVLCTEDVPDLSGMELAAATRGTFLGRSWIDAWHGACVGWPRGITLASNDKVILPMPALILSGNLDPVTPPHWGEVMSRHFAESSHVVVEGAGHNVSFSACVPDLIAQFIDLGTGLRLDTSCVASIVRPPFVTSRSGPRP